MKKLVYTFLVLALMSTSCSKYLDQVPDDRLTIDETFRTWATAERFLADVYRRVPDEYGQRDAGSESNRGVWTGGCDEAEFLWSFVRSNDINIGNWDANSGFVGDYWRNFYRGIRGASVFMENADKITDLSPDLIKRYKAEARALRAMYYFYLIRIYGPVVILGDQVPSVDMNIQLPRNSFDECVAFITSELEKAATDLPTIQGRTEDYGRITKGVAMAFRANALMYAASPLYNGNTDLADMVNKDGKHLISQTYDANKWKVAADAYQSFLSTFVPGTYELYRENDASGNYSPYLSCRNVILKDWNKEVILARPGSSIGPRQYELTPYHAGSASRDVKGSGGLGATQNMVDAFFMKNGRNIDDPQSGYVKTGYSQFQTPYDTHPIEVYNQWVDREPRFYVNITFDGSTWLNTSFGEITTRLYNTGNSGKQTGGGDYSPTGYIVRKAMGTGKWDVDNRSVILLRLAEIYLSYAECLNEAEPGSAEALRYLNLIRERAGIPQYGSESLPAPAGQDALREAIRKERKIEMAFENNRFFDVRRWKIGEQTQNGPMYGLNIASDLPDFLKVVVFETRVFNKRHYFFPIPTDDVNNDKQLVQNPGW
ncbi:RagB/SusD family nutrient uptake outer membrane protein [Chitinophaga pinensis]|uniref:RagB/SusD domain protein n=1 Tax=Chitinophaga pinensis (strain ATCC 43595 / DSM 2588 / LMG 13176 / NBRC 15968 / NCIMB 11800 / UQM 2034) TaxID=485918 RepID=A0A979G8L8_CHIPD|nr:RagB/SusD family nutrient uptake outer membrane protein [Chitinophaga pinensis]ACU62949.1 RagB/SusD domain protein [Chitinophaga pinensis DSM 2588]